MQSDNSLDIINEYKDQVRILKGQIAELEDAGKSKDAANKRCLQKLEFCTKDLDDALSKIKKLEEEKKINMLPYNLLFKLGSKAVGSFMTKRAEKSERKHQIALQEMQTGNERAKRNGSLILDLVLGAFILAPLGILAYATFYGDMTMLKKVEFYFEQLKNIPEVYLYLIFIVVGGNYGISVTNLLSNKKFKK